jgi:hypothetical protein
MGRMRPPTFPYAFIVANRYGVATTATGATKFKWFMHAKTPN